MAQHASLPGAPHGCSFAATWVENQEGQVVIVATTFRAVEGAWTAAPVAVLGPAGGWSGNSPAVAWDGGVYVVAWADDRLHLQRMAEDGELLGEPVRSFDAPGNVYLRWLEAAPDASLRLGFTGHDGPGGYDVRVARVAADGATLVVPTALTTTGAADVVGFLGAEGGSTALWTATRDGSILRKEVRPTSPELHGDGSRPGGHDLFSRAYAGPPPNRPLDMGWGPPKTRSRAAILPKDRPATSRAPERGDPLQPVPPQRLRSALAAARVPPGPRLPQRFLQPDRRPRDGPRQGGTTS